MVSTAASALDLLVERGQSLAVAESLTGGLLAAEFVAVPGASRVFTGGVVAYNSVIKTSVLGVDAGLLAEHGAVHPDVAAAMAAGARTALAIDGVSASFGLATTGVAGPDQQDGRPVGTVFLALAGAFGVNVTGLRLAGNRAEIRRQAVDAAVRMLGEHLANTTGESTVE